jgi:K+-sensing histidine kinase KdpD
VRELVHARSETRKERPFARIVLGVAPRLRDAALIGRAGRIAQRLDVDLRVVTLTTHDDAETRSIVDALAQTTKAVHGTFVADVAAVAATRIVEMLGDGDVLAVESPRNRRRFLGRRSFAVQALAAGARELLVLAPVLAGTPPISS